MGQTPLPFYVTAYWVRDRHRHGRLAEYLIQRLFKIVRCSWFRRTRIDGDSWQGTDVPLGEDVESYILRIRDTDGVLQREASVGVPAFSYSDTMRASDGVTAPYTIEVAQVSARFGPGPFARIEIND